MLARSNWFRTSPDELHESEDSQTRLPDRVAEGGENRQRTSKEINSQESSAKPKNLRTTTIMFIKFSKGGMMQKKMRETQECERGTCQTFAQPEERNEPCTLTLRNVVYESKCTSCNPPGT